MGQVERRATKCGTQRFTVMSRFVLALVLSIGLCLGFIVPGAVGVVEAGGKAGESVVVGAGETIDDDAFLAGRSVTVKGTVTGELLAAGDNVVSGGAVGGDALLAGRMVTVENEVQGDVRVAGQNVAVNARVGGNAMLFGQVATISSSADISRNLTAACETLSIDGKVAGKVRATGEFVTVNGQVGGDLIVEASRLVIGDSAEIGGDVLLRGEKPAEVAPGARVHGEVRFEPLPTAAPVHPARRALRLFLNLVKFVVLGVLIALFAAKGVRAITDIMAQRTLASFGVGIVSIVVVPVLLVILGVIVVGASAAWVLAGTFAGLGVAALFTFKALVAILVGRLVLRRVRLGPEPSLLHAALIGTVIVYIVTFIPGIDVAVGILGTLLTLGALILALKESVLSWPGGRGGATAS